MAVQAVKHQKDPFIGFGWRTGSCGYRPLGARTDPPFVVFSRQLALYWEDPRVDGTEPVRGRPRAVILPVEGSPLV